MRAPDPRLDEIQAIPVEAVEAAAEWLPHSDDCEARPERDCTCWKQRVNLMREALEAAHPYLLAELRKAHEALAAVKEMGEQLEASELNENEFMRGRGSGFRIAGVRIRQTIRAAVAAAKGDERECEYCAEPEFRQHKGFCLTRIEGAPERWRKP